MKKMNTLLLASFISCTLSLAQVLPNIVLTDIDGNKHQLYHALDQGYIIFLDFSFVECGPCNEALPEIISILDDFENQNLLLWYASDRDDNLKLKNYLDTTGLEAIAAGPEGGVEEAMDAFLEEFSFFGFPTISIICPDKSIQWGHLALQRRGPGMERRHTKLSAYNT